MTDSHFKEHLGAEPMQAFLEGELSGGEHARVEEHLAVCARCSAELDGWRLLFSELAELPALEPRAGFAERVLGGVVGNERLPIAARVRRRLSELVPALGAGRHLAGQRLQDFVEGLLPARQAARIETHVDACFTCGRRVREWRAVFRRLDGLGRFAPADGFTERVIAAVRIHDRAPAAPAVVGAPAWSRALAAARSLLPRTRRAWAAVSGVAVSPAVTAGLALYVVFSHPTLTPGALLSFAWWKATALGGTLWGTLLSATLESSQLFGIYSLAEYLSGAPIAFAGGVLGYTLACALALSVLYKNLIAARPVEHRYARASVS